MSLFDLPSPLRSLLYQSFPTHAPQSRYSSIPAPLNFDVHLLDEMRLDMEMMISYCPEAFRDFLRDPIPSPDLANVLSSMSVLGKIAQEKAKVGQRFH
ncbi:Hypothetical predicted protein [Olea europaea subsp. europaea]|uniref:Uncharacterized protein n=1 Tax=Olea europaea subsp. europaea TaxID=158383 RepID=A0A8S0SWS0_OLEEU|nr:Hypothetical predicted protein [Olea europaea subsp. europaea]